MKTKFYIQPISSGATKEGENNDCAVRALTNITGKSYDEIHAVLKKHGRKDRKGTFVQTSLAAMQELGFEPIVLGSYLNYWKFYIKGKVEPKKTLNQVVNDLPKGKYVVYVNRHATALIDGQIVDTHSQAKKKPVHVIWYHPRLSFS
jgi:hypothetical protein